MQLKICYTINDGPVQEEVKHMGGLPIMVKVRMFCRFLFVRLRTGR